MVYQLITVEEVVGNHSAGILISSLLAYATMYLFLLVSYIGAVFYLAGKPAQSLLKLNEYGLSKTQNVNVTED